MPILFTRTAALLYNLYTMQVNTENADKRASLFFLKENIPVGHEEMHFVKSETEINFEKNWHGERKYVHGGESVKFREINK